MKLSWPDIQALKGIKHDDEGTIMKWFGGKLCFSNSNYCIGFAEKEIKCYWHFLWAKMYFVYIDQISKNSMTLSWPNIQALKSTKQHDEGTIMKWVWGILCFNNSNYCIRHYWKGKQILLTLLSDKMYYVWTGHILNRIMKIRWPDI